MPISKMRLSLGIVLIAISISGCSGPKLIPVMGKVTYQGKPLEFGSVMFQPSGEAEPARGKIQNDGTFVLTTHAEGDGCAPGSCQVRVTCYEGQKSGADSLGALLIPKKYTRFGTSGVSFDVSLEMPQPVLIELD